MPEERHEHYDADGNLTGFTVVTREPEWDDEQREAFEDLRAYESEVHVNGCGLHDSIARENPDAKIAEDTCPKCAEVEVAMRVLGAQDAAEEAKFRDVPGKRRKSDGRRRWLQLKTPQEIADEAAASTAGSPKPQS